MAQGLRIVAISHMYNQRIILWAALGDKNLPDGFFTQGIGAKAVHRFGREAYKLALAEQFSAVPDMLGQRGQKQGIHERPLFCQ